MNATDYFTIQLNGDVSLKHAADLAQSIQEALTANQGLRIDATGMTSVDIAVIQLLASAHKSARALGKALHLDAPADGALAGALKRAGILSPQGQPQTPEGDFWVGRTIANSGEAA